MYFLSNEELYRENNSGRVEGEELWDENLKLMDSKYKLGQSLSLLSRLILSANLEAVLLEAGAGDQ